MVIVIIDGVFCHLLYIEEGTNSYASKAMFHLLAATSPRLPHHNSPIHYIPLTRLPYPATWSSGKQGSRTPLLNMASTFLDCGWTLLVRTSFFLGGFFFWFRTKHISPPVGLTPAYALTTHVEAGLTTGPEDSIAGSGSRLSFGNYVCPTFAKYGPFIRAIGFNLFRSVPSYHVTYYDTWSTLPASV